MIPFVSPLRTFRPKRTIREMVLDVGLVANLAVCLDPGDKNSWSGLSQNVVDVSGNGRDFTLGASASPSTDDPTFNGVSGRESEADYFLSDGGDGFQKASANDAFMDSLHKTGWDWTLVTVEYFVSGNGYGLITKAGAGTNATTVGVSAYIAATLRPVLSIGNGSAGLSTELITSGAPTPLNTLLMTAWGSKHYSTTSRDFMGYANGVYQLANYTNGFTPSAGAAGTQAKFGLLSDGSSFMGNGRRFYGLCMFNRLLSQVELDALRASFKRRWTTI